MTKPRCYMEYCSNEPEHDLTDFGEGKSGPFNPDRPVMAVGDGRTPSRALEDLISKEAME